MTAVVLLKIKSCLMIQIWKDSNEKVGVYLGDSHRHHNCFGSGYVRRAGAST